MADNYSVAVGQSATFASDELSNVHHPYYKVEFGADGTAVAVSTANPLPVTIPAAASGYTEGTTVGTATSDLLLFRSTGGTLVAVGTAYPLPSTLQTLQAGEDLINNVQKTEQRFSYASIGSAGTTTVKGNPGFLHELRVAGGTLGPVTVYDAVGTSSQIMLPTVTPTQGQVLLKNISFSVGLTVVTGSASVLTGSYR